MNERTFRNTIYRATWRRVAKTVAVVVAVAATSPRSRPFAHRRDSRIDDTVAGRAVAAPAAAGTRSPSPADSAVSADRPATIVAPLPAATDTTTVARDVPAGEVGAPPGPSPRASCPALPASPATCISRSLDRNTCPALAQREPTRRQCLVNVDESIANSRHLNRCKLHLLR